LVQHYEEDASGWENKAKAYFQALTSAKGIELLRPGATQQEEQTA
jgi:hypothetical protein